MRHEYKESDDFKETMKFGEVIRKARRLMGMNQADFSEELGIFQRTESDYEKGKSSPPIEYARELLDKIGFDILIVRRETEE